MMYIAQACKHTYKYSYIHTCIQYKTGIQDNLMHQPSMHNYRDNSTFDYLLTSFILGIVPQIAVNHDRVS